MSKKSSLRIVAWTALTALLAAAPVAAGARVAASTDDAARSTTSVAGRDLPREWTWAKKAVSFDHMYRTHR